MSRASRCPFMDKGAEPSWVPVSCPFLGADRKLNAGYQNDAIDPKRKSGRKQRSAWLEAPFSILRLLKIAFNNRVYAAQRCPRSASCRAHQNGSNAEWRCSRTSVRSSRSGLLQFLQSGLAVAREEG
jgi:hypothetical protein